MAIKFTKVEVIPFNPEVLGPTPPPAPRKIMSRAEFDEKFALPRAPYLNGQTKSALKPWLAEGISRRTWYRRKEKKEK